MNQTQFTRSSLFQPPAKRGAKKRPHAGRGHQRRKPRWKERVAPRADDAAAAPADEGIDDAALTRCTRCPAHRGRAGRFRPLIGNQGEYLCDGCYRREFPATAMLDDPGEGEVRRLGRRAAGRLRDRIADGAADIAGATRVAGDVALRGGDDGDLEFPSEIECRACLDRGAHRRCCDGYYCHACYFRSGGCPGCGAAAHLTGIATAGDRADPGTVAVGLSWALSLLLVVLAAVCLAVLSFNAYTTPMTVWGHTCRGWFPRCDLAVCVDHEGGDGYGEGGGFVPAAQPYRVCDREASARRAVGSACIYDRELYAWSDRLLGYDLCTASPREEDQRPRNVSSLDPLLLHVDNQSGVYVFDDDFELPLQPVWTEIVNGNFSKACGVNDRPPERGKHGGFRPAANERALVFTGVHARHASTVDLNIEFGGRLEFYLIMGDVSTRDDAECKSAFSDVVLEYQRAVASAAWVPFATHEAWRYRGRHFQFVSREVPHAAWSNATRFRFRQAHPFDVLRDHWALDDVRILAHLRPRWEDSGAFRQRQTRQDVAVKTAQCCYNTDLCSAFDKRRILFDEGLCASIPAFDKSKSGSSRMKLSELRILFLWLAAVTKALYRFAVRRFTRRALTTDQSHFKHGQVADSVEPQENLFPRHSYSSPSHLVWQYAVVFILNGIFVGTAYRLSVSLLVFGCGASGPDHEKGASCETSVAFIFICLFAGAFDMKAIWVLLCQIFFVKVPWKRQSLEVVVDLHPERGYMRVGSHSIPLSEVSDIKSQSPVFHGFLSAGYTLGGLPFALGSLTIQSFRFSNDLEQCATLLGCVAILREVFGPSLFVKFYLIIGWVLAHSQQDRDDLGRSLLRKGLLQQCLVGSALAPILLFSFLCRRVETVGAADNFFLFLASFSGGGLLGLLLGLAHGLPVVPAACLSGRPDTVACVVFTERVHCPCLFSCTYCSEIHSRQVLLVLALDDLYSFKRMLLGNLSNVPVGGTVAVSEQ